MWLQRRLYQTMQMQAKPAEVYRALQVLRKLPQLTLTKGLFVALVNNYFHPSYIPIINGLLINYQSKASKFFQSKTFKSYFIH